MNFSLQTTAAQAPASGPATGPATPTLLTTARVIRDITGPTMADITATAGPRAATAIVTSASVDITGTTGAKESAVTMGLRFGEALFVWTAFLARLLSSTAVTFEIPGCPTLRHSPANLLSEAASA